MWTGTLRFFEQLGRGCEQASHLNYRSVSSGKPHNRKTDTPDATLAYLQAAQNSHDKVQNIFARLQTCNTSNFPVSVL